jgi:hypothetical protein
VELSSSHAAGACKYNYDLCYHQALSPRVSSSLVRAALLKVFRRRMIEPFNSCQMAACEVSQIVTSIISAYNSGLDVFKKLKCKKRHKSSSKETKTIQEEALLQSSLQHRPRDIRTVYNNNVAVLGHRFEIGDTIAHSALAHTLLVLNSGLINVLNSSLSDDVMKRRQSQRSLLSISEVAAADALYALGQLNYRLTAYQPRIPAPLSVNVSQPHSSKTSHSRKHSKTIIDVQIDPKVKSRAENNLLVRGGWVRPRPKRTKSGSAVTTAVSSRNASTTKLLEHKRRTSGTSSPIEPGRGTKGSPRPRHSRTQSSILTPQPPPMAELPSDSQPQRAFHAPEHRRLQREPSMLIVPSDFFDSQIDLGPSRPSKNSLYSSPSVAARPSAGTRPRPPSVATFMTTSTKIGEIPESRWPDRIPQPGEVLRPMPYTIPPPLHIEETLPKKRRGLKFWKRSEPAAQAIVY